MLKQQLYTRIIGPDTQEFTFCDYYTPVQPGLTDMGAQMTAWRATASPTTFLCSPLLYEHCRQSAGSPRFLWRWEWQTVCYFASDLLQPQVSCLLQLQVPARSD